MEFCFPEGITYRIFILFLEGVEVEMYSNQLFILGALQEQNVESICETVGRLEQNREAG